MVFERTILSMAFERTTLYSGNFISPDFPKAVFTEMMQMATSALNSASTTQCTDRLMVLLWVVR